MELIAQLPDASRTSEAILNDPQQAALIAEGDTEQQPEWTPKWQDYSLHTRLLVEIREALTGKRFPRPVTAVDHARRELARRYEHDMIKTFTPHALDRLGK